MRTATLRSLLVLPALLFGACTLQTHPQLDDVLPGRDCARSRTCDAGPPIGSATGNQAIAGRSGKPANNAGGGGAAMLMSLPDAAIDAPAVVVLKADGQACGADDQCQSAHCDGVCCAAGDCCVTAADCDTNTALGMALVCNDPASCQGSRGAPQCTAQFRCFAEGEADDRACGPRTVANTCGAYLSVFCNGQAEQTAPACPTSCKSDGECDAGAHCDKVCVPNAPAGGTCNKNSDCVSNHCTNHVCCADGDCCASANDCPLSYSGFASCDSPTTCQGTSKVAVCMNSQCASAQMMDDSACTADVVAKSCGAFVDVHCKGTANQQLAVCRTSCQQSAECDPNAYCSKPPSSVSGSCVERLPDASKCSEPSMCLSSYCGTNSLCCSDTGGQCCLRNEDCIDPKFSSVMCVDPNTCRGTVSTPFCNNGRCIANPVSDTKVACMGRERPCAGNLKPATCPDACKARCDNNADCISPYECAADGTCKPHQPTAGMGPGGGGSGGGSAGIGGGLLPL